MDRKYKAKEKVKVFATSKDESHICTFYAVPYSFCGWDNYRYKNIMYKGFWHTGTCKEGDFAYILLSEPCTSSISPQQHNI